MSLHAVVYEIEGHSRSRLICGAMADGIAASRDQVTRVSERRYSEPVGDVAVFYGLTGNLPRVFADYQAAGKKAVYVDLGYWGRRRRTRWDGFHKIVVNARHPTAYFQNRPHSDSRSADLGVRAQPWTTGRHILIAGMGAKGAIYEGMTPAAWERDVIAEIRKYTDRPIVYRPKPNWREAQPIDGTVFDRSADITESLRDCHAVVTHHSNVAVDGLVAGIPAFCFEGAAMPLASCDLARIETPRRPDGREQWIADLAWTQWSIEEMQRGAPWKHLKSEGLL